MRGDVLLHELVLGDRLAVLAAASSRTRRTSARQSSITPRHPAATLSRPLTSVPIATRNPSPSSPSRFSAGTAHVLHLEHRGVRRRHAHLGASGSRPRTPAASCRRRTRVIRRLGRPPARPPGSANTMTASAMPPLEMRYFTPLRTYPSAVFSKVVVISRGLLPASGSVRPNARIFSPRHGGRQVLPLQRLAAPRLDRVRADAEVAGEERARRRCPRGRCGRGP